jgi:hypothetical protein
MTAAPSIHLPEELIYLMESVASLPAAEVAACALSHLERFSDSLQKAEIAAGGSALAGEAAQALEVMSKFPHYPRPRAAVAMAALKGLAAKAA